MVCLNVQTDTFYNAYPFETGAVVMKFHVSLHVNAKQCPLIFQGDPSNFKITRVENRLFGSDFSVFG